MTGMHSDHTDKHHTYWKVALGKLFSTSEMPIATVITASYANTMYSGNSSFFTSSGLPPHRLRLLLHLRMRLQVLLRLTPPCQKSR